MVFTRVSTEKDTARIHNLHDSLHHKAHQLFEWTRCRSKSHAYDLWSLLGIQALCRLSNRNVEQYSVGLSQNWIPTLGLGSPVLGHTNTTWQFLLISEWVYCHFAKHQKHLWYLIPVLTKHELKGQICFRTPNRHSSNSSNMCQLTMFPAIHTARHWKNWNAQSAAESAMVLPCHFQHRLHQTTGQWDHCLGLSWETVGQLGWSYIWHLMILCSQLGPACVFPVLPRVSPNMFVTIAY